MTWISGLFPLAPLQGLPFQETQCISHDRPHAPPLSQIPSPAATKYPLLGNGVLGHLVGVYGERYIGAGATPPRAVAAKSRLERMEDVLIVNGDGASGERRRGFW